MALFGEQNYGTPFGAFSPSGFFDVAGEGYYDYSGFSSREGFFGFSGQDFEGFSSFCGQDGMEFSPWRPTLVSPRNYSVLEGVITIVWEPGSPPDVCGDTVTFDVQFTSSFSTDSGWRTIGTNIPSTQTSLSFDVSGVPFTEDGGIRVRAKDNRNLFSRWSSNVKAFTIKNHAPTSVSLLSPVSKQKFDNFVLVIWREADPADIDGHQVFYTIQVTSTYSLGTGWVTVPGAKALTEGTTSFSINSFDFPEGNDYGIRVFAFDELGAMSEASEVGQIRMVHSGNFIIDTLPPYGTLSINDGDPLANDPRVKLSLFAKDDTTGVKDVRFRNDDEDCWGDWDTYAPEKFWDLSPADGVKRVFVQYRDYANNVSEACDCEIVSRVLCDEGNATDLEVFGDKLYVAFDANGNLVEYRILVRQASEMSEPEVTALAHLDNALYVATYDPDDGDSGLYIYDGIATRVSTVSGSKVNSMVAYNDKIYLALESGRIMEYDGSLSTSYSASSSISRLKTDGTILFASVSGGGEFLSFDGTSWRSNSV